MSEPTPPTPPGAEGAPEEAATGPDPVVIAQQEAALRRFAWLIAASGAGLLLAGGLLGGLDFAVAVLLGSGIVLLNFIWTKRAVKSVLFGGQPRNLLALSFLVKFGVTGVVLFYAILRLHVDALGVLVGLSALVVGSVLFALTAGGNRHTGASKP